VAVRQVGRPGPGALLSHGARPDSGARPGPGAPPRAGGRRRLAVAAAAAFVLLAAREARAPAPETLAPAEVPGRLASLLLGPTPLQDDLRHLCDRIGGRPTGGAALERAADWFLARFRAAGADLVWAENFTVPHRWQDDRATAAVTGEGGFPVRAVAMPFSAPTRRGGVEAEVVPLGEGGSDDFAREAGRLRGAFALVDSKVIVTFEDLFADYLRLPPIMDRARSAGVAGLLLVGARERGALYRHIASHGVPVPLPMAILGREDGLRVARLAREGRVRMRLEIAVRTGPAYSSRNVLAEIRGREIPDEVVLAGAHLDSWDLGTGALDNGANCVLLLDVARQMAGLGLRPRRSIRFALFTGEEQGLHGSLGYVRAHRAELDRHVAAAVFDIGTGRFTGFSTGGREDLFPAVKSALRPVQGYGAATHTADAFVGTDNFDFLLEGVPNLVAHQDPSNYMEHYHAESDTYDKADLRETRINAAIAAALLWGLAEAPERAPRQTRADIAALIERTGVAAQMKAFGLWEAWEKKERGRPE
jgi:hypothetical protein